jgi:hypothetical protein
MVITRQFAEPVSPLKPLNTVESATVRPSIAEEVFDLFRTLGRLGRPCSSRLYECVLSLPIDAFQAGMCDSRINGRKCLCQRKTFSGRRPQLCNLRLAASSNEGRRAAPGLNVVFLRGASFTPSILCQTIANGIKGIDRDRASRMGKRARVS